MHLKRSIQVCIAVIIEQYLGSSRNILPTGCLAKPDNVWWYGSNFDYQGGMMTNYVISAGLDCSPEHPCLCPRQPTECGDVEFRMFGYSTKFSCIGGEMIELAMRTNWGKTECLDLCQTYGIYHKKCPFPKGTTRQLVMSLCELK